jgi:2-oxoisovalerate dehydrogenase E1 component
MIYRAEEAETDEQAFDLEEVLEDYTIAYKSRQASLIGRREVLSGKAKFGIFGDGKEAAQVALAKVFRPGDFRSGYYRDQTMMFALGMTSIQEFFAQLYAHADVEADPNSAGRSMNAHFASRLLDEDGRWKNLMAQYNTTADISPTGSQMPRLVGLAYASRLYRELDNLHDFTRFSNKGGEIAFGTIGNASCAEGMFWEAINAGGVLQGPLVLSIWDDGYGISVTNEHQMVKEDIGALLQGFQRQEGSNGYDIYVVKGWDYPALVETYRSAAEKARRDHIPAIVHVIEVTQPQGHSTSGSHERYKSAERLAWEEDFDCLSKCASGSSAEGHATDKELAEWEKEDGRTVEEARKAAWEAFQAPILKTRKQALDLMSSLSKESSQSKQLAKIRDTLKEVPVLQRNDIASALHKALVITREEPSEVREKVTSFTNELEKENRALYDTHLYSSSEKSPLKVPVVPPEFSDDSPTMMGFEVLNAAFDAAFEREPRLIAFGEDVGMLGDVNQGMHDLQEKYGLLRVTDTGIREATILGQAIGMALRGLRPICEMQYLDYLVYALQLMSDDLATLRWRTAGRQKAPVIIRTRGHRLVGIWHSGSQLAGILNLVRGMHVLVPRNMTQAAGFYNTLLQGDDPALVIEVLNGYRRKERKPDNLTEFTVPLGVPEILRAGKDITLVTYGALVTIALESAERLAEAGIDCEVIDVQSLLPFDINGMIVESLKKTSRILFVDEDVPGGGTAYMMQEVIEKQGGFWHLDAEPRTIPGQPHRPAYGSDGDYWSKPNVEQIFETVYEIMNEADPASYPIFYA